MRTLKEMTRAERSLLLFLECRLVDYRGGVATVHMNKEDFGIASRWTDEGFINFKCQPWSDVERSRKMLGSFKMITHTVTFSEEAWNLAHQERKNRYERNPKYGIKQEPNP